jgi:hypothetical protein
MPVVGDRALTRQFLRQLNHVQRAARVEASGMTPFQGRDLSPIDQTARRHFAKFRVTLSEQQTCLNPNHRLRQRYPAALDAKVARRSSALRLPAPASSTGP